MSAPTVGRRWRDGHLVTVASLCIRGTPALPSSSPSGPWPSANTSSTWTASRARSVGPPRYTLTPQTTDMIRNVQDMQQTQQAWSVRVLQLNCLVICFDKPSPSLSVQSKIHAARSLSEIAIDLTETGTLKTSKLANMGSKGKIISGSSGSLLSSGQYMVSVCERAREREKERERGRRWGREKDWYVCVCLCVCMCGGEGDYRWQLERQKQLLLERCRWFCAESSHTTYCTYTHTHPMSFCMYRTPLTPSMSHRLILQGPPLNIVGEGMKRAAGQCAALPRPFTMLICVEHVMSVTLVSFYYIIHLQNGMHQTKPASFMIEEGSMCPLFRVKHTSLNWKRNTILFQ